MWEPTAEKENVENLERDVPVWLPGIPTYSKWRNSACDCLDILHWHANSVIGAARGMEHPTVLHLHLARVILLTPFREIVRLADLITQNSASEIEIKNIKSHIKRWVIEDQYKARLAMIHAGVLFWHIRHYSVNAFYEPSSVFLATLALWAYGHFAVPTSRDGSKEPDDKNEREAAQRLYPTTMQLDRPADDELVQLFVRRGDTMKANIIGVGNLCSKKGNVRMLIEGKKLIAGLQRWGGSRNMERTLEALVEWAKQ